jgi:hypothetical protein
VKNLNYNVGQLTVQLANSSTAVLLLAVIQMVGALTWVTAAAIRMIAVVIVMTAAAIHRAV